MTLFHSLFLRDITRWNHVWSYHRSVLKIFKFSIENKSITQTNHEQLNVIKLMGIQYKKKRQQQQNTQLLPSHFICHHLPLHIMTYLKSHFQHKTGKINGNKQTNKKLNHRTTTTTKKGIFSFVLCVLCMNHRH